MSPLALMIRPHGSSPHHSLALILALTAILASKPFPLAHIISSAPSMLIALGGENSLSNSLVWFRPRPADRRTGRPSSSARRRCARPCWRAPPGQIELVFDSLALDHPARP